MSKEYVIGLDIGTTSVKAVVFDRCGKVTVESEQLTKSFYPQPNHVEQDPEALTSASVFVLKDAIQKAGVTPDQVAGIGFSCAMHSLICVDENGRALSRAIIWADGRGSDQAERLMSENGLALYEKTGTPIHPMSPLVKLLWMNETGYEPFQRATYFMSVKEYLLLQWFGKRIVDYSMASATGLFNGATLDWDMEILELVNVKKEQLSRPVPPTEILTGLNKIIADYIGIPEDIPFVIGAADGQLANLGSGAILPGEVAITAGTSGAVRQWANGFRANEKHETFCYMFTEETSIIGGPTNNGGIALEWLKNLLNYQGTYEEFTKEAGRVGPGADGILFLPYINGERAPLWNQHARGNFFGMSITHQKEHFVRAVLEGITFNLYQISEALERLAGPSEKIYVNGGLARSPIWLQMMADVFGKNIYVSESHHNAAWGAAWTALVAVGEADSFEDIKNNLPMGEVIVPNAENHKVYQSIYEKYVRLAADVTKYF
ncbi:gluconokinase [Domibacillus aminovorans]|uniref:Gluconokinase n=1 Tax=Domibacillus aminovorans TaxID=29332 RepID=A0A177KM09_9BACI|nr:gluconokinase [Domibacillus aminovorans]OAH54468.1 gluconokinase [Domibacillus aminovorans]